MTFDAVATALATLAAETKGASPVLTPELRAQFEKALAWLVFEHEYLVEPHGTALDEKFRQVGESRNLWLHSPSDHRLLVDTLYRRGPAGLDDRLLCLALSGLDFGRWVDDCFLAVAQQRNRAARFWKEFEDKSPGMSRARLRNLWTIPLEELDRLMGD